MDPKVKGAFIKVKEDMFVLSDEINFLRTELSNIRHDLSLLSTFFDDFLNKKLIIEKNNTNILPRQKDLSQDYHINSPSQTLPTDRQTEILESLDQQTHNHFNISLNTPINPDFILKISIPSDRPTFIPTDNSNNASFQHIIPTLPETPTYNYPLEGLKTPILDVSTGNGGVPTDRQTDRQTDQHTTHPPIIPSQEPSDFPVSSSPDKEVQLKFGNNDFGRAAQILDNLDSIKKDIRRKFKRLTRRELEVFSLLYSLEDQGLIVDYKLLSERLTLSESSIRDYIGKIIAKGIPLTKEKVNNKQIILAISSDLKKIASLDTILKLVDI